MGERIYRTEALILRRSDLGEADRLLLLATPSGKRRVVAKGARKTTSKLAGHIELFMRVGLLLAKGRNLDIITQSEIRDAYATLRAQLPRLSCAYYAAELYDRFGQEGDEHPDLYELLTQTFAGLDRSPSPDLVLRWYELQVLRLAGYQPHLYRCAVCQAVLTEEADRFSPTLGGVLCPWDAAADPQALPMSNAAFRLLRYLQSQPLAVIEQLRLSPKVRSETEHLLRAYLRRLLERDLRSIAFLEAVMRIE